MPTHASADMNAASAPASLGSADETLKAKTPKKPKGWKKWKRRLSRVFKGKKKTKESTSNGPNHAKSAHHPERGAEPIDHKPSLEEDPHDDDDGDDDGTDGSPVASEKEVDPSSRDSRDWRQSRRSEESSIMSERGEDWEYDDAVEQEPEDNGEGYDEEEDNARNEARRPDELPQAQCAEDRYDDGVPEEEDEVEYEEEELQQSSDLQEPPADHDYEEQEFEDDAVAEEEEYEEEHEEELEASTDLQASECVDPGSSGHNRGEYCDHEADEEPEVLQKEDDGGDGDEHDEQGGHDNLSASSPAEVTGGTVEASPSYETIDGFEQQGPNDCGDDHDDDVGSGADGLDDRRVDEHGAVVVNPHLELTEDLLLGDRDPATAAADECVDLSSQESSSDEDTDAECIEEDTVEAPDAPVTVPISDIVFDTPPSELSATQQHELAVIVASVPTHLSLVLEACTWCVRHSTTESTECQLFLVSVETGKWKLAELLAEKLHRDHLRLAASPQDDEVVNAILAHCAA